MDKHIYIGRRRWEYKVCTCADSSSIEKLSIERLKELGEEGWELVCSRNNGEMYFKREKIEDDGNE